MKLSNNVVIPDIGLGTWLIPNDKVGEVVLNALKVGYTHIDTAQAYENEEGIGKALKSAGIPRDSVFITTKVKAEYKDYESAKRSIEESLRKLQVDYVDLLLIHCPVPWNEYVNRTYDYFKENVEVWKAFEEAYESGKAKSIGISNFEVKDIKNIFEHCKIRPMVNQILTHVGATPFELIDFCKKNDIVVEAYSPIAHGAANRITEVNEMAEKYNKSFAQICLRYCLDLDTVILPKASSLEHLKDNFDLDFKISKEDFEILKRAKPLSSYGDGDKFPSLKKEKK